MCLKLLPLIKKAWLVFNHSGRPRTRPGFSLIEVLLAISVFSVLIGFLLTAPLYGQEAVVLAGARGRAVSLAEEGLEVVRYLRDENSANLLPGTYGLTALSGQWSLQAAPDTTGVFSRQITVSVLSATTSQIISEVNWRGISGRTGSVVLTTYLTNWR